MAGLVPAISFHPPDLPQRPSLTLSLITGSISIEDSSAWAKLFARDNCESRSKNAL